MNIVFAINSHFLLPFSVALYSLLAHNRKEIKKIFLLIDDLPSEDLVKIHEILGDAKEIFFPIEVKDQQLSQLVTTLHFNRANYYRLLIPELVQEDKVIYLDADLLVLGSLLPIWHVSLDDSYLAAVCTLGVDWHPKLGINKENGYFNSGVMVLNLKKWREDSIGTKVIQFITDNPKVIWFVDQCGLNAVLKNGWIKLPPQFNWTVDLYNLKNSSLNCSYSSEELTYSRKNPVIVHFTGSSKPWHTSNQHAFKFLFWKYLWKTPYSISFPKDLSVPNALKFMTPKVIRNGARWVQYRFFPRGKFKW